ncbi:MAG TPA: hypothetical protein VN706_22260 [Gemmatimonadaceae bacterium]|nr:hypothetical protein [Gemmatimonadaceae bacterium]
MMWSAGRRLLTLAAALVVVTSAASLAQTPSQPSAQASATRVPAYRLRLLGVFDEASGDPVDSVKVTDVVTGMSSQTTKTGTVALVFLPDGGSLVRLQKLGYEVQTLLVAISPSDTTPVTVVLRRVTQLGAVVTKADSAPHYLSIGLRGFEERRKTESGYFVDEKVLRANEGRPLANVLASRAPGFKVVQNPKGYASSAILLLKSPRCASGGPPQVYLDGVPLAPDLPMGYSPPSDTHVHGVLEKGSGGGLSLDELPFDLSKYDVTTLGAVEWYPDSDLLPIGFAHTSGRCGALMLWTRER